MLALYIILGIILFFILVLSIRVKIHLEYEETATAYLKWLFIKIPLIPFEKKEKKEKKPKKPKEEKPKEEEEKPKEEKPKKPSFLKSLYEDEGIDGIMELVRRFLRLLNKFGYRVSRCFVFNEIFLDVSVTGNDAADTAEKYGKMCYTVFPPFGAVCSLCKVRKYNVNVYPDYIAVPGNKYYFSFTVGIIPRKLINSLVMFAVGALNKLGFRLLKDMKNSTKKAAPTDNKGKKDGGDSGNDGGNSPDGPDSPDNPPDLGFDTEEDKPPEVIIPPGGFPDTRGVTVKEPEIYGM